MSKPWTSSNGGVSPPFSTPLLVDKYVVATGPVATVDGSVSSADCMDLNASRACGSEMDATAVLDTHDGSAEGKVVLAMPVTDAKDKSVSAHMDLELMEVEVAVLRASRLGEQCMDMSGARAVVRVRPTDARELACVRAACENLPRAQNE